jgi:hypothetical protein
MRVLFGLFCGIVIGIVGTIWFYANGGRIIFAGRELGPGGAHVAGAASPTTFTGGPSSANTFDPSAPASSGGNMSAGTSPFNVFRSSSPPPLQGSGMPPSDGFGWPPLQTKGKHTSDATSPTGISRPSAGSVNLPANNRLSAS